MVREKYKVRALSSQISITHTRSDLDSNNTSHTCLASSFMRVTTTIALSGLLAAITQACTRVQVNEVFQSTTKRTRELKLWDNDEVTELSLQQDVHNGEGMDTWDADGYIVTLRNDNSAGFVTYPTTDCKSTIFVTARSLKHPVLPRLMECSDFSNALTCFFFRAA